jgi:hypothetical protein
MMMIARHLVVPKGIIWTMSASVPLLDGIFKEKVFGNHIDVDEYRRRSCHAGGKVASIVLA